MSLRAAFQGSSIQRTLFSGAAVHNAGVAQNVNHATVTTLTFSTELADQGGYHSVAANTDRLTVPVTGYYLCIASVVWNFSNVGTRVIKIPINGSAAAQVIEDVVSAVNTAGAFQQTAAGLYFLSAGDYVTMALYQDSGGIRTATTQDGAAASAAMFQIMLAGIQ